MSSSTAAAPPTPSADSAASRQSARSGNVHLALRDARNPWSRLDEDAGEMIVGLRFRKSFQLFPGVRLNVGKSGLSATFGVPGASLNFGSRGARATIGLPGTGLSYSTRLDAGALADEAGALPVWRYEPSRPPAPSTTPVQDATTREIRSARVEDLTSESLVAFKKMISDAEKQRKDLANDKTSRLDDLSRVNQELSRRKASIFSFFYRKRLADLSQKASEIDEIVAELEDLLAATYVALDFSLSDRARVSYDALVTAFGALAATSAAWDITSDQQVDRVRERSHASRSVNRRPVRLAMSDSPVLRFEGKALTFPNANGSPFLLYPNLVLVPHRDGQFALIDYSDLSVDAAVVSFVESETVPRDATVVGHTWEKTNKDGSPDRRFNGNRQLPICSYGRLAFSSPSGINEEFQFSSSEAALSFGRAFADHKAALRQAE